MINYNELIEFIERAESAIELLKVIVIDMANGNVPDQKNLSELMDDKLFEESFSDRKNNCVTETGIIIEHLLKLKYSTNNWNNKVWINTIKTHRSTLMDYIEWRSKRPVERLINYLNEDMDRCYEIGINRYKEAAEEYYDLREGLELIPEECPWTIEDLLSLDIDELLEKMDITDEEEIDNE